MNVRLENIQTETVPSYVSFLNRPPRSRTDRDSIHSVSSVRSVLSNVSAAWSTLGWSSDSLSKSERAKAAIEADLKYLYSAFTKIPCLRLAPDNRARLIRGYEEFPFDTAVPLHAFKNLGALEVVDMDFRSFFGWDRLSEQLRSLTIKRSTLEDPAELLTGIVLDDMDKRRRRSAKTQQSYPGSRASAVPASRQSATDSVSIPGSPTDTSPYSTSPQAATAATAATAAAAPPMVRARSEGTKSIMYSGSYFSPSFTMNQKQSYHHQHSRAVPSRARRTSSGSSFSCETPTASRRASYPYLIEDYLPSTKWRFLKHLGLPDNSLTTISADSLSPVADSLQSIDLSSNLFTEIPDSLASLVALRAVNLSHCMIKSLRSLSRNPLPAITALNLRGNRLRSLAGIERLPSLERLDLRDNDLSDPTELARLTSLPEIREIWVSGNPFVRTHWGYRVVVFNLFRRCPGYSEDILIDGTGPGYAERKQLVDRVMEPQGAPVVRRPSADPPAALVSRPVVVNHSVRAPVVTQDYKQTEENPISNTTVTESKFSTRTKKSRPQSKRTRSVVGYPLAGPVSRLPSVTDGGRTRQLRKPLKLITDGTQTAASSRPRNTTVPDGLSDVASSSCPSARNVDVDTEADRRYKLSILKQGVGPGWLDSWENAQREIAAMHCTTPSLILPTGSGIQTSQSLLSAGTS